MWDEAIRTRVHLSSFQTREAAVSQRRHFWPAAVRAAIQQLKWPLYTANVAGGYRKPFTFTLPSGNPIHPRGPDCADNNHSSSFLRSSHDDASRLITFSDSHRFGETQSDLVTVEMDSGVARSQAMANVAVVLPITYFMPRVTDLETDTKAPELLLDGLTEKPCPWPFGLEQSQVGVDYRGGNLRAKSALPRKELSGDYPPAVWSTMRVGIGVDPPYSASGMGFQSVGKGMRGGVPRSQILKGLSWRGDDGRCVNDYPKEKPGDSRHLRPIRNFRIVALLSRQIGPDERWREETP
ncbi:hypothetical protein BV25DRAFT_1836609 [Artomyces pyxidatus]|uniref:Uncharacterized protein n=1 Tax=Artomyces pyxidatus TaxID=48021 RepID=A0ACB8T9X8_9AGAM|nr:hypothetical protein BV25DRAFT_1836609 [Artomyces pyxidatus]